MTTAVRCAFAPADPIAAWCWEGRGTPTVWLHHGIGTAASWDRLLPGAAGGRPAVVYDRRGFGAAPRRGDPGLDLFDEGQRDLAALIERLGGDPVHLVGHSDGGTIALLLAARRPDLTRSVAVIAAHARADPITIGTLQAMGPPRRWAEPLRNSLQRTHGDDWEEVAAGWHRLWTSSAWSDWSIEGDLPHIHCPLLVVHDRRDPLSPPLHAETIAAAVAGATTLWTDTSSHDPHRHQQAEVEAALARLWRAAETAAP